MYATRGRYPASSSSVNSGKKIAIGGSITATTQASVRNIPSTSSPCSHGGACRNISIAENRPCAQPKKCASHSDGAFAPAIVSHSTAASPSSMMG